jgi:uncharacterized protein YyaL (SSP411 family)
VKLNEMRQKLFREREKRIHPHKDDKVLTAWNGLMISALAQGAQVLNESSYAQSAAKAADFILKNMQKDGKLLRRFRDGESAIPAFQEDYAFFALSLLDLYEATFEIRWLEESVRLTKIMQELFQDEQGGYFYTASDSEKLIARTKDYYDGATPSGNSAASLLLLRLSKMTGNPVWEKEFEKTIASNQAALQQHPVAFSQTLSTLDFAFGPSREIVLAGNKNDKDFQGFREILRNSFDPSRVLLWHPLEKNEAGRVERLADFIKEQKPLSEKTTAYVCRNRVCDLPVTDPASFESLLKK